MDQNHKQCLLLNADYTPLCIISWQKAIVWSIRFNNNPKYSIEIIDFYKNDYINGVEDKKYPIPAIAKTSKYFNINNDQVVFSRKNIFLRDNHTCQYCNNKFDIKELTYDHVIPKSLFKNSNTSPTSWTNIVTACVKCNRIKGNRTPKQANMPLKNLPVKPKQNGRNLSMIHNLAKIKYNIPDEWKHYLPQSYLL